MKAKSHIRSIRFSEDMVELIERQVGDNFSQKFENLVTRCVWELPAKENELKTIDRLITEARRELREQQRKVSEWRTTVKRIDRGISELDRLLKQELGID